MSRKTPINMRYRLLSSAGLHRLSEELAFGGSIARRLSRFVVDNGGYTYALAPIEASYERLHQWDVGGLASSASTMRVVSRLIESPLDRGSKYLVAEDAMRRSTDPSLDAHPGKVFMLGDEVYEFLSSSSGSEDIEACLRRVDAGYALNAFVAHLDCRPDRRLISQVIEPELILTRAYDGESFILWRAAKFDGEDSGEVESRRIRHC